jgi:large subunit ribosomal protein L22
MAWTAKHRYARVADRKARLVANLIRGRHCDEAVELLRFTHKRAGKVLDRVLKSAMAMNRLFVTEARIDPGPIIKRWHPKDRGRAHPIMKRTSHITVSVEEKD